MRDEETLQHGCVCPLGRQGQHCQQNLRISDGQFELELFLTLRMRFSSEVQRPAQLDVGGAGDGPEVQQEISRLHQVNKAVKTLGISDIMHYETT